MNKSIEILKQDGFDEVNDIWQKKAGLKVKGITREKRS